ACTRTLRCGSIVFSRVQLQYTERICPFYEEEMNKSKEKYEHTNTTNKKFSKNTKQMFDFLKKVCYTGEGNECSMGEIRPIH
ncbi:MAG: hypothetical protein IJB26_01585, partial [Clostridia bacterium]|nr:hypothetical protein [Clostridia bacterium]